MIGHVILDAAVLVLVMIPFGFILAIAIGSMIEDLKLIRHLRNKNNENQVRQVDECEIQQIPEKEYYIRLIKK